MAKSSSSKLFPTAEEIAARAEHWDKLLKKYEDMEDDESNGVDLDDEDFELKMCGKVGKASVDETSDGEESDASLTDDDFVEKPEENNMQLVLYKQKTQEEKWAEMYDHYGAELIDNLKLQMKELEEKASKMNLPLWNVHESSSSIRMNETLSENCSMTLDTRMYSRNRELSFEQSNVTRSFQLGLPQSIGHGIPSSGFNRANQLRDGMSNQSFNRALEPSQSLCDLSPRNYATPMKAMSSDVMQLMRSMSLGRIKVVEREYYFEMDRSINPAHQSLRDRPALRVKPQPMLEDAQTSPQFVANSESKVKPQSLFKAPALPFFASNNKSKVERQVSFPKSSSSKSLKFEPAEKSQQAKATCDSSFVSAAQPKLEEEISPIKKDVKPKTSNTREAEKTRKTSKPKKLTMENVKALEATQEADLSLMSKQIQSLALNDMSIGSSYHTESSEDEKFWCKDKFDKLRERKQEQHKKDKLMSRTLEMTQRLQEVSKAKEETRADSSSSDEYPPRNVQKRGNVEKAENSVKAKEPALACKSTDSKDLKTQKPKTESQAKQGKNQRRQKKNKK